MVVFIVAIVFGSRLLRTWMVTRNQAGRSRADDQVIRSMQAEINRLTDRVQVLERLVTDDDRNLSREIDGLRGRPASRI